MKRTIRRQMTRLIIPALVALLVSGPAKADDSVLLTCTGSYLESDTTPMTKNVIIAKDGSWIDYDGKILRTNIRAGRWTYEEEDRKKDLIKTRVSIDSDTLEIEAIYKIKDRSPSIFMGGCSPIKNPFTP